MVLANTNHPKARKIVAVSFFELENIFCHFPIVSKFLLETRPQISEDKDHARENLCFEAHLAMDPSFPRIFMWRNVPVENCTLRFRSQEFWDL